MQRVNAATIPTSRRLLRDVGDREPWLAANSRRSVSRSTPAPGFVVADDHLGLPPSEMAPQACAPVLHRSTTCPVLCPLSVLCLRRLQLD